MPPQTIHRTHLARLALIYHRLSTEIQLVNSRGSIELQKSQIDYAIEYGWEPGRTILEIKDDLGLSATDIENRPGWQRMLALIEELRVGAIFTSIWSRWNRDRDDWSILSKACRKADTLVVVNGRVSNLRDHRERLQANIFADIAEFENLDRREHSMACRRKKAEQGIAVTAPPAGFEAVGKGQWVLDREERVWLPYRLVFEIYLRERSTIKTQKCLLDSGTQLLRRANGEVIPTAITQGHVNVTLRNAAYKGELVFGLHPSSELFQGDPESWPKWAQGGPVRVPGHHPAIVEPALFDQVQEVLHANLRKKTKSSGADFDPTIPLAKAPGAPGKGPGLAQGRIRCFCGCGMYVSDYDVKTSPVRHYNYMCLNTYKQCAGGICAFVSGPSIDAILVDHLLRRLPLPSTEVLTRQLGGVSQEYEGNLRSRAEEVKTAKQEAERLEREFLGVDREKQPDLKESVGERAQAARAHVKQVEAQQAASPLERPAAATTEELMLMGRLREDIRRVWEDPSTTNQEKKLLLRCFLKEVRLVTVDRIAFEIKVCWKNGEEQQHRIVQPKAAVNLLTDLAAEGKTAPEILGALRQQGLTEFRCGAPVDLANVYRYLWYWRRHHLGMEPWPKRRVALEAPLRELKAAKVIDRDIATEFERRAIPNPRGGKNWTENRVFALRRLLGIDYQNSRTKIA